VGYFTQTDLEAALSLPVVKAAYDDTHSNTVSATGIAACIAYGTAQCDSFLRKVGQAPGGGTLTLPMESPPDEVKFAALDFGIAYTMRRRPDVVKAMNVESWLVFYNQAVEQMQRYVAAQQMVTPTAMTHATAGGSIFGGPTGTDLPSARWSSWGDFA